MISLIVDDSLKYPEEVDFYSPDERFPEYRYAHVSERENPVYRAVRECLAQAGLDREHFGTPSWNPLGTFIRPGSRVFVLCNFVFHRLRRETAETFPAKCIDGSVLRPIIDYLLLAVGDAGSVAFGNAAMQSCSWESVLHDTGAHTALEFYRSIGAPVEAADLRLLVMQRNHIGRVSRVERRPESDGVPTNLGTDSLMIELDCEPHTSYGVMYYDLERLRAFHSGERHVYVIHRQVLEADTILNLAKLKTHEKTGISCALKNYVGAVGHKDSLPHYRLGCPEKGGDEYPSDRTGLLRRVLDGHYRAQRTTLGSRWGNILRVADRLARAGLLRYVPVTEGGWCGNDTAWRMVLDLARVVTYANRDGEMEEEPCRQHLAFVDGIVGGEGEGPLYPEAVRSGMLMFSDSLVAADFACALMMGFDPQRIPMLREALRLSKYPLVDTAIADERILYNGRPTSMSELQSLVPHRFKPPMGWNGRL